MNDLALHESSNYPANERSRYDMIKERISPMFGQVCESKKINNRKI